MPTKVLVVVIILDHQVLRLPALICSSVAAAPAHCCSRARTFETVVLVIPRTRPSRRRTRLEEAQGRGDERSEGIMTRTFVLIRVVMSTRCEGIHLAMALTMTSTDEARAMGRDVTTPNNTRARTCIANQMSMDLITTVLSSGAGITVCYHPRQSSVWIKGTLRGAPLTRIPREKEGHQW